MELFRRHGGLMALVVMAGLAGAACQTGAAESQQLEQPVPLAVQHEGRTLRGHVVAWSETGFSVRRRDRAADDDATVEVAWADLPARQVAAVHGRLFGTPSEAAEHLALARHLSRTDDADTRRLTQRAAHRAMRLDESLTEQAEQLIAAVEQPAANRLLATADDDETDEQRSRSTYGESTPEELRWPAVNDDEQADAIEQLIEFAEETALYLEMGLQFYESEYFLFCTDLPPDEARRWYGLLDRMYELLLDEFAIEPDTNIWRGKALVFVFNDPADYRRFQRDVHQTEPGESVGMCHNFANGNVHIAFYRHDDPQRFAHILVHEATHGFVHRYRSRVTVPSWINEGLAEWVAYTLVPDGQTAQRVRNGTRDQLVRRGSLEGFFEMERIDPWQYGVAFTLTDFLISQDTDAYVQFFQAIKDGMEWQEAMQETYGVGIGRLTQAYGDAKGVRNLRP